MKTEEFYNKIALDYEELIASDKVNAQLTKKLKEIFSKYKITKGTILDVGCGPGNLKTDLGDGFEFTGIDISENMLDLAKKKGYKVIRGKIEDELIKITDKSFDYVVALSSLHFVKEIKKVLDEFNRIAKKGWIVSLDDITEEYVKNFFVKDPLYNHVNTKLLGIQEDIYFRAWTSPTTNDVINARMVFKKLPE